MSTRSRPASPQSSRRSSSRRTVHARRLHRALFLAALGGGSLLPKVSAQSIAVSGSVQTISDSQYVAATPDSQSSWTLSNTLAIGRNAPGSLHVSGGAIVSGTSGVIGTELITSPNGDGTVTIDGEGSAWNMSGQLNVGQFAPGALTVSGGGAVTAMTAVIGSNDGGVGTVTITGSGSSLTLSGGNPSQLIIGSSGTGEFSILDGGFVSSSDVSVGQSISGTGSGILTVSGTGSRLEVTRLFSVGDGSPTSRFEIRNGGSTDSAAAYIGSVGGFGEALVTGANSAWTIGVQFYIGMYNAGSLRIEDQASVTSAESVIGIFDTADVTVSGTGTRWNSTTYLGIGYAAGGSLTVEKGALVTTPAVELGTEAAGAGELILLGDTTDGVGTLETGALEKGAGSGSVRFDGGRLRANATFTITGFSDGDLQLDAGGARIDTNSHDITTSAGIAGDGGLTKEGEGTLYLEGDHTYLGATVIEAGRLLHSGHLSSGEVIVKAGAIFGSLGSLGGDLTIEAGGKLYFVSQLTFSVLGEVHLDSSFGVDDLDGLNSSYEDGTYNLITGTETDFSLLGLENWGLENPYDLGEGKIAYFQGDGLTLVIASLIPEPASATLLAGLGILGLTLGRRRSRSLG